MRTIHMLVFALLACATPQTFAQSQEPANASPGAAQGEKSDKASEAAKNEARKARREHRRTVNHRQRRKH
jgi:hypothetical protein